MSRSRHPRCSRGRGCGVCGDAGANRRARERSWHRAEEQDQYGEYLLGIVWSVDGTSRLDYAYDVEVPL